MPLASLKKPPVMWLLPKEEEEERDKKDEDKTGREEAHSPSVDVLRTTKDIMKRVLRMHPFMQSWAGAHSM